MPPAYAANAAGFAASVDRLAAEIRTQLAPVKARPFIVFHDAYQYFERHFGLNAVGSIADTNAASPSAQRLRDIRGRLKESGAVCVFREPQFDAKFAELVIEGSSAKLGVLDPLGADLAEGPEAYFDHAPQSRCVISCLPRMGSCEFHFSAALAHHASRDESRGGDAEIRGSWDWRWG